MQPPKELLEFTADPEKYVERMQEARQARRAIDKSDVGVIWLSLPFHPRWTFGIALQIKLLCLQPGFQALSRTAFSRHMPRIRIAWSNMLPHHEGPACIAGCHISHCSM